MKDGSLRQNGAVVVTIELPGADSLSYAAIAMSEPLSKLAALRTVSTKRYVYNDTAQPK